MIAKHFTKTSNKVELQINHVRINRARPVHDDYCAFLIINLSKYQVHRRTSYTVPPNE